ncbi:MAG: PorT family protein [Bacteroidales bacterium]|nr:PorT family protein [Bacteroidales bacterium]MCF8399692.1 PorT family protein [Bacteroidales bacterium]
MKKLTLLFLSFVIIFPLLAQDQISDETKKKFSIGIDIFSDIWQDTPDDLDLSTINRGINVFGMYNYQFGKSNFSVAIGAGIGAHNMYSNGIVGSINDSTVFDTEILDTISYKKSKINLTFLDIPFEFRLKTRSKFRMAIGFKIGFMIGKHAKYKGDALNGEDSGTIITKSTDVRNLETFRYGPTFRIGYKWINLFGYYQINKMFKPDQGPQMYPITVGISLMPF